MELSESYKNRIQELAGINILPVEEIKYVRNMIDAISKRVPVLKSFERFDNDRSDSVRSKFQKHENFGEKILATKDKSIYIKNYYVFSEFTILYRHFNDYKWYYFIFKNELIPQMDDSKEEDKLFNRVFMMATKMQSDKFAVAEEIRIPEEENLSPQILDSIVNKLNKATFDFEEYLTKHLKIEFF